MDGEPRSQLLQENARFRPALPGHRIRHGHATIVVLVSRSAKGIQHANTFGSDPGSLGQGLDQELMVSRSLVVDLNPFASIAASATCMIAR